MWPQRQSAGRTDTANGTDGTDRTDRTHSPAPAAGGPVGGHAVGAPKGLKGLKSAKGGPLRGVSREWRVESRRAGGFRFQVLSFSRGQVTWARIAHQPSPLKALPIAPTPALWSSTRLTVSLTSSRSR